MKSVYDEICILRVRELIGDLMAKVIGVVGQKGGSAKTTTSINIACALASIGKSVLLVDLDNETQASSLSWSAAREGESLFPVVGLLHASLHKDLPRLGKDYDYVIIDGPPHVGDATRAIVMCSDLILVPVQPSPLDVWAAAETMKLLKEGLIFRRDLKIGVLITRKIANTAIGRDVSAAMETYEFPVLANSMTQRVVFAESLGAGQSVFEMDGADKAVEEVRAIVNEILEKFFNGN